MDLGTQNLYGWLLHGQVGHLNVETVEVNALQTLANVVSQSWLANTLQVQVIWNSTRLMELSEKAVEIAYSTRVVDECVPISAHFA